MKKLILWIGEDEEIDFVDWGRNQKIRYDFVELIIVMGSLGYEILMGLMYGVGVVFYVTRIPERWRPGVFDVVGHNH
ncbi:hypothetical protein ACS0TY_007206 [Phlomoides rotata]